MALKDSSGTTIPTIQEAASYFDVSRKTIREWIRKEIIPAPPEVEYGTRTVQTFPEEYLKKAEADVKKHREAKKNARRNKGKVRKG